MLDFHADMSFSTNEESLRNKMKDNKEEQKLKKEQQKEEELGGE